MKIYLTIIIFSFLIIYVKSVIPSGEILLEDSDNVIFSAPAYWAGKLPEEYETIFRTLVIPQNGTHGCFPVIEDKKIVDEGFYLMVERGECTFEHKAKAAYDVGALGVIIYNSLKGIYQGRDYALPADYECNNGEGWVQGPIDGPVWEENMIKKIPSSCPDNPSCGSNRCLFTNNTNGNGTQVCCAWDLYIPMGPDQDPSPNDLDKFINKKKVEIPAVFIRIMDSDFLIKYLGGRDIGLMGIAMFSRPLPPIDIASFIIWIIAMTTVIYAADSISNKEIMPDPEKKFNDGFITDDGDSSYSEIEGGETPSSSNTQEEETIEISTQSAFAFIAFASLTLLLFFYIDLHILIIVVYILGATLSLALVFIYPNLLSEFRNSVYSESDSKNKFENSDCIFVIAISIALVLTGTWYFYRTEPWAWVIQDIMGASVCICFLNYVRLPNLQVATLLLTLAFFYDIFFVFITPYLFGSSIMVHVAQGGEKPTHDDPNFCEKYPNHPDCRDTTAPNLLIVPSIGDYRGGSCMLGLGDIIIPGLFLVLVARIDVRQRGFLIDDDLFVGLFGWAIFGYGSALIVANLAVNYFQFGQPALLYIVPFMLLPVLWKASSDGTLELLWEKLPLPKTIAVPLGSDEQRRLLSGSNDIISASATWGESTGELNIKVSKNRKKSRKNRIANNSAS